MNRDAARANVVHAVLAIRDLLEPWLPDYALKRRDKREPGRREKEEAEEKLAAVLRRILRKQAQALRAKLEAQYPDRKAVNIDYEDEEEEEDEDIAALILMLLAAVRGGISLFSEKHPVIDYTMTNTEAAKWARDYAYKLIKDVNDVTRKAVGDAVSTFISTPELTIGDLVSQLDPIFGEERAQRIAVTETTRAYAEGQMQAGRDLIKAFPEMRVMKVWYTEQDDRVCDICLPLDGQEVGLLDGFGVETGEAGLLEPPAHVNCRCWIETYTIAGEEE